MSPIYILFPAIALVFWTFCILLLIPIRRIGAMRSRQANMKDFRLGESSQVPEFVCLANRNYMNLLELPILFYLATIFAYITNSVNESLIWLASLYTFNRIVHSLIHVTYNNVSHRFLVFGLSNMLLMILWIQLVLELSTKF
jgi:hypothetical protein